MKRKLWQRMMALAMGTMMVFSLTACGGSGKAKSVEELTNPQTTAEEVAFPLAEEKELSFITLASADSTQVPNERIIFQRMQEKTNVKIN